MLKKKAGIKKIHFLRNIRPVEADFNTALKLYFAEQLISKSEKTELTEEQWGSYPGRQATDPALCKILSFEYGRALYVTMAPFANDVTACFDQMLPNISTLDARKYDMEPAIMITRNLVMIDMEHSVRKKMKTPATPTKMKAGIPKWQSKPKAQAAQAVYGESTHT